MEGTLCHACSSSRAPPEDAANIAFHSNRIGRDLRRDRGSYSNDALQRDQEREAHKVMKILTVVVIVFALLMLPNHIVFLWFDFGNGGK